MPTVRRRVTIDATKERVWEILADIGGIDAWAPTVDHAVTTNDLATGVGCERACQISGMGSVTERVEGWDEGTQLVIGVAAIGPMKQARSTFDLEERDGRTTVTMEARFETRFGPLGALMGATIMRRRFDRQVSLTLAGLKQYAETGQPISSPDALHDGAEAAVA